MHREQMFRTMWHKETIYKLCIEWQCSFSGVSGFAGSSARHRLRLDKNIHRLGAREKT